MPLGHLEHKVGIANLNHRKITMNYQQGQFEALQGESCDIERLFLDPPSPNKACHVDER